MSVRATGNSPGKGESAGAIASASTGVAVAAVSVVTAACCVSPVLAPILVSILGASGAVWAAGLKPYSWWIFGGAFLALAYGFWVVYRPRNSCAVDEAPKQSMLLPKVAKVSLWFGATFWLVGVMLHLLIPQP